MSVLPLNWLSKNITTRVRFWFCVPLIYTLFRVKIIIVLLLMMLWSTYNHK